MSGASGQAFVYVIGTPDGPQKIGVAMDSVTRLRGLRTAMISTQCRGARELLGWSATSRR